MISPYTYICMYISYHHHHHSAAFVSITRSIHIRLWAAVCSKPSRPQGSLDLTEAKQCGAVKWRCNQNRPGTNPKLFERRYPMLLIYNVPEKQHAYFRFSGFCKTLQFESLYFKILKWGNDLWSFVFVSSLIVYIKRDSSFPHLHDRTFMGHYH